MSSPRIQSNEEVLQTASAHGNIRLRVPFEIEVDLSWPELDPPPGPPQRPKSDIRVGDRFRAPAGEWRITRISPGNATRPKVYYEFTKDAGKPVAGKMDPVIFLRTIDACTRINDAPPPKVSRQGKGYRELRGLAITVPHLRSPGLAWQFVEHMRQAAVAFRPQIEL